MTHTYPSPYRTKYFVDSNIHSNSLAVLKTRAQFLDIEVIVGSYDEIELTDDICGVMLQYPNNDGYVRDYSDIIKRANQLKVNILYMYM